MATSYNGTIDTVWTRAFHDLLAAPGGVSKAPVVLTVDSFQDGGAARESATMRLRVDEALKGFRLPSISATAATIFPHMAWRPDRPIPRERLYQRYLEDLLPRLRARSKLNRYGTYFQRMIQFQPRGSERIVNQLENILSWWERDGGHPRRSALQVSIFDPTRDHTGQPRAVFPCLQQLSFSYDGDQLSACAYYPSEYLLDRGYGNYLGLCNLTTFMAHEMGLRPARVDVVVSRLCLGSKPKAALRRWAEATPADFSPVALTA
jgi:hypothetical protein